MKSSGNFERLRPRLPARRDNDCVVNTIVMGDCLWPEERQGCEEVSARQHNPAAASHSIDSLTTAMMKGDETAYRAFYNSYGPRLFRYLLVISRGNEEEAREALQLTLVRVVRYIKEFSTEDAFWSWLTVLARSSAKDEARRRSRYFRFIGRFFNRVQLNRGHTASEPDARLDAALNRELAALPHEERDLIERKYFNRERVSQIAETLGTTEKAVESRLVRIRRKLKDAILKQL